MTYYTQLSMEERYTIYAELKIGSSINEIARKLARNPSTISREVTRNQGLRGYRPKQAHNLSQARRYQQQSSLTAFAYAFIAHLLSLKWSPAQISGALRARGWLDVPSHEWIYQFIYHDKANGGCLYQHLRCQKAYRKRGFANQDRRGQIANKRSIHLRDSLIEQRLRLGDFEGDTIIGKHHKGAILTLVDRKSLYTHIKLLGITRGAEMTMNACIELLTASHAHSVTFDNGKEFAQHQRLDKHCIDAYFADPYHSNQRARNENTNGLIRQYLPKSSRFDKVTEQDIAFIAYSLNHRPRKTLNWFTPNEVMGGFYTVALRR